MVISKVHCFFEQSGTFKNEFQNLGIKAFDYDLLNDFGQTDFVIDLFSEIDKAYEGFSSIFDNISSDDLIIAFFPCYRFSVQSLLSFTCSSFSFKDLSFKDKVYHSLAYHHELSLLYDRFCRLFLVCFDRGFRLIVENPYHSQHYLTKYFPIKPTFIDYDRRDDGDYYKKPTQYWFLNCSPESNLVFEPLYDIPYCSIDYDTSHVPGSTLKIRRSMIHPQYARRFIMRYLTGMRN